MSVVKRINDFRYDLNSCKNVIDDMEGVVLDRAFTPKLKLDMLAAKADELGKLARGLAAQAEQWSEAANGQQIIPGVEPC